MALLKDRKHIDISVDYFMSAVAEEGIVVALSTGGSGAAMDDSLAVATASASPSGVTALGVLLTTVVNYDLTKQRKNTLRTEEQINSKVAILQKGWVVTDKIIGTPSAGDTAYLHNSGNVSATQLTGAPTVGVFQSSKDADGFAKLVVNLP